MFATIFALLCKISGDMFRQDRHILVQPSAKKTLNEEIAISESMSCVSFFEHKRQKNSELKSSDVSALESVIIKSSSYFWPYFFHLYSFNQTVPLHLEEPSPNLIPPPICKDKFYGTLFWLLPDFTYNMLGSPVISQGSTFVFKGHTDPYIHHVVKWCRWQDQEHVYLKLVGMSASGHFFPYNDPNHPSIILIVPWHQSLIPYLLQLAKRLWPPQKKIKHTHKFLQWLVIHLTYHYFHQAWPPLIFYFVSLHIGLSQKEEFLISSSIFPSNRLTGSRILLCIYAYLSTPRQLF